MNAAPAFTDRGQERRAVGAGDAPVDAVSGMKDLCRHVERILREPLVPLPEGTVHDYVAAFMRRRAEFLLLAQRHGSPLYVLDETALRRRTRDFRIAFEREFPLVSCYFAVKSNNHPRVAKIVLGEGFGLDVSSGLELEAALAADADDIVFSGPGKTSAELALAVAHADRVTILMDSFGELHRLTEIARGRKTKIRAGVRITPPSGPWRKFGVPLDRLRAFWEEAGQTRFVDLAGLQFHTSWNLDPTRQIATLEALDQEIRRWPRRLQSRIAFLDLGGGFWPPRGEWLLGAATGAGKLRSLLGRADRRGHPRYLVPADPLDVFARRLAASFRASVFDTSACRICLEPGRWISNDAMHLLVTVVDRKDDDLAIVDAGTNAIGWERFESDFAPLVNLSRPALEERKCQILGSLCTPHDVWGDAYWGRDLLPGDVLLVPDQGAYTYSLRQQFIKQIPPVVSWDDAVNGPNATAGHRVAIEG